MSDEMEGAYRAAGLALVPFGDEEEDSYFEWHQCPTCPSAPGLCACAGAPWPSPAVRAAVDAAVEWAYGQAAARITAHADRHHPAGTELNAAQLTARHKYLTAARLVWPRVTKEQVAEAFARGDFIGCRLDDAGRAIPPDGGDRDADH